MISSMTLNLLGFALTLPISESIWNSLICKGQGDHWVFVFLLNSVKIIISTDPHDFGSFFMTRKIHFPFLPYVSGFLLVSYSIHFQGHCSIFMLVQVAPTIIWFGFTAPGWLWDLTTLTYPWLASERISPILWRKVVN